MSDSLLSINGINKEIAEKLKEVGIGGLEDLLNRGSSEQDRKELAKSLGYDQVQIDYWIKQADLLRVKGLKAENIDDLLKLGIKSTRDLKKIDLDSFNNLIKSQNEKLPLNEQINIPSKIFEDWKWNAEPLEDIIIFDNSNSFETDININENLNDINNQFFFDMKQIIVSIGEGIAEAQQALDFNAIETQKTINNDEELRNSGIAATFYTMPETNFSLKMNYTVKRQASKNGKVNNNILISPINARYQNLFKMTLSSQSELNVKFVPTPPPPTISQIIIVPDLISMNYSQAKKVLLDSNLIIGETKLIEGIPENGESSEIVEQTPIAGSEARFNDKVNFVYKESNQKEEYK
ncbi:DUF4332 domain-containing protein [Natronospora cellulosivora (SeqCode)]